MLNAVITVPWYPCPPACNFQSANLSGGWGGLGGLGGGCENYIYQNDYLHFLPVFIPAFILRICSNPAVVRCFFFLHQFSYFTSIVKIQSFHTQNGIFFKKWNYFFCDVDEFSNAEIISISLYIYITAFKIFNKAFHQDLISPVLSYLKF